MIVYFVETEQDAQVRIEAIVEIPVINRANGEVKLETFDWKPGLSARVDEEIEAYGNRINNMREELMEKEKAAESGRSERDEKKQKLIEAAVNSFRDLVKQNSDLHAELKSHSADLKKLMADIAQHGQFKCSLRLKVPDSEPGGIELLVTDGPDETQNE
jgi:Skp family chaperone for outer membrane proteins